MAVVLSAVATTAIADPTEPSKQVGFNVSGGVINTSTTFQFSQTANRIFTCPDTSDTLTVNAAPQTLTNKTIDALSNTVLNIGASSLSDGSITNAKLQNSSITVSSGTGLSGGGLTSLGGSTTLSLTVPVTAALGGTGQTSYTIGDVLYANTASTLTRLADVATGSALISGGVATAPSWGKIGLTTHVSGVLSVGNGGTGSSTALSNNRVMVSNGGAIVEAAALLNGQLLIGSTGAAPVAATLTASTGISITNGVGSITIAAINNGTVTSVGLSMPVEYSVSNSPVTTSGVLTVTKNTQSANTVYCGPSTGAAAAPTFRALAPADIPQITNSMLQNSSVTISAGTGLSGGGVVALGGSTSISLTTPVTAATGGTGLSSYAVGDIIYASAATTLSALAAVGTGNALISNGVATQPSWGKIGLTTHVTGVLPVSNGGTNSSTALSNNRVMVSSGGAIVEAAGLTNGQLLIGSTGAAPVAAALTAGSNITITNGAGSITITSTGASKVIPVATMTNGAAFSWSNGNSIFGGTLVGSNVIPANTLAVGDVIYIRARATMNNGTGSSKTVSYALNVAGSTTQTTGNSTVAAGATNYTVIEAQYTVATGPTIVGQMSGMMHTSSSAVSVSYSTSAPNYVSVVLSSTITIDIVITSVSVTTNLYQLDAYIVKGS